MKKEKAYYSLLGLGAGMLNGLFGAGGGVIVVPLLEYSDIEARKAHATSIAIIASLSLVSCIFYLCKGSIPLGDAWMYLPLGFVGAVIGSLLLKKIPNRILKRLFGAVMILSAVRLLLR